MTAIGKVLSLDDIKATADTDILIGMMATQSLPVELQAAVCLRMLELRPDMILWVFRQCGAKPEIVTLELDSALVAQVEALWKKNAFSGNVILLAELREKAFEKALAPLHEFRSRLLGEMSNTEEAIEALRKLNGWLLAEPESYKAVVKIFVKVSRKAVSFGETGWFVGQIDEALHTVHHSTLADELDGIRAKAVHRLVQLSDNFDQASTVYRLAKGEAAHAALRRMMRYCETKKLKRLLLDAIEGSNEEFWLYEELGKRLKTKATETKAGG
jgi:hypothetical protein